MKEHIVNLLTTIAFYIDVLGGFIMVWGFFLSLIQFFKNEWQGLRGGDLIHAILRIRFELGSYLLLGLEFMIAGDVIHTVLDPAFEDIILLSVIVVIRTALAFFLGKEMESLEKESNLLKEPQGQKK